MNKTLKIATNKYLLTGIAFLVWMAYFDRNDWYAQRKLNNELKSTRDYIAMLRSDIAHMKAQRNDIQNNPEVLEKFARENYRLKRDNEDVYVFE